MAKPADYNALSNQPESKPVRRALRSSLTPAEAKLWTYLKGGQLDGRKFRRQHSFGGYILDVYCPAERLAIELDGKPHFYAEAIEKDQQRDAFLAQHGIRTLRFVNRWVFDNPEGVLNHIRQQFGWWQKTDAAEQVVSKLSPSPRANKALPLSEGEYPRSGGGGIKQ